MPVSVYPSGGEPGPWALDDYSVMSDGYPHRGIAAGGAPTVDGANRPRPDTHRHGGMVNGHDGHLAHGRDSHRSQI